MTSTYSPALRLELMATGDQSGTWGDTTNTNLGTLLEQAITGVLSVAEGDTTLTLTSNNGASDQARNAVVNLTGAMTAARNVVVPTSNKLYLIKNSTTGGFNVTVKTAAGTGVEVAPLTARWVYCDGTNVVDGLPGLGYGYATTATAAGTTTLTVGSAYQQFFTGSTTQTVQMPVTSTLVLGQSWRIVNDSTGLVTVNSSGGNAIVYLAAGSSAIVTCISLSGTSAASWSARYFVARQETTDLTNDPFYNLSLSVSVAANALTIALKDSLGNDPSASSPVIVNFRSATATSGLSAQLSVTAATSLVVSSGSTLGTSNGVAATLAVVGFNDAGTFRLGIINPTSLPLSQAIASSTAEGGAGAADSANVFYSGTAVASKAYTLLGLIVITEATAGTWVSAPTSVQVQSAYSEAYVESTWTPVLSFTTPGNLNVAYGRQVGTITKKGREVTLTFAISCNTFTHSTASGSLVVTGLPYANETLTNLIVYGTCGWTGITKAGFGQISPILDSGSTSIQFNAFASGSSISGVTYLDVPSGGTPAIFGQITYRTTN